ncbi:MAG TPA: GNAT family N-acetyltransferase, partial [Dehalococcoidia bacterium]|nr:GNAT family N-acetyltransferase [Dehalococcoidia bacterium]
VVEFIENFLVAEAGGRVVAAGGFELYGSTAVLRSIVVEEGLRGRGIGRQISEALMEAARRQGASDFYLFTIDSPGFWQRLGFEDVPIEDWPEAARRCFQWQYVTANIERFQQWGIRSMRRRA